MITWSCADCKEGDRERESDRNGEGKEGGEKSKNILKILPIISYEKCWHPIPSKSCKCKNTHTSWI